MRLNKENYELILFDLLEGELSPEQAELVMDQIEADAFFKAEWVALNQTVLPPHDLKMSNKAGLKKNPMFLSFRLLSVAASVLVVMLAGGLIYNSINDIEVTPSEVTVNPIEDSLNLTTPVVPNNVELVQDEESSVEGEIDSVRPVQLKNNTQIDPIPLEKSALVEMNHQPSKLKTQESPEALEKNNVQRNSPQPQPKLKKEPVENIAIDLLEPKGSKDPHLNIDTVVSPSPQKEVSPQEDEVQIAEMERNESKNNSIKILGPVILVYVKAKTVLNGLKSPKVKFKTIKENSRPGINIAFTSKAYKASAMVMYKTKK